MTKLDNLIFQKSKDFYTLEKRRGSSIKCFCLVFTEEDVKTSWENRKLEDLKIVMPTNFEELEQFKSGHLLECFQNMDRKPSIMRGKLCILVRFIQCCQEIYFQKSI